MRKILSIVMTIALIMGIVSVVGVDAKAAAPVPLGDVVFGETFSLSTVYHSSSFYSLKLSKSGKVICTSGNVKSTN